MVDLNPARGMPIALQRYWLVGKGALKIRWNVPHDFDRCVRNLRKYFPTNPQGLCNILHTKATGGPPGHGGPTHNLSIEVRSDDALTAATNLLAKQPVLGKHLWAGPLAPIGRPTQEPRITRQFDPGSLKHRILPLPVDWREAQNNGHTGAVTVGRIMGITFGPDENGQECCWAWGDWLDEEIIPASAKAQYLVDQGVVGASVDPGGSVSASVNPETGTQYISDYTIGGITLVSIPAFSGMQLRCLDEDGNWPDDEDMPWSEVAPGAEGPVSPAPGPMLTLPSTFSVHAEGWRGLPLATRMANFDNDEAVQRIAAWAAGPNGVPDPAKLQQAFLYHDDTGSPTATESYRLPVGDIINGQLTIIYHAIYAAAALLSGAHGGLPNITDPDKVQLRTVITAMYGEMANAFDDPRLRAPWDQPADVAANQQGYNPPPAQYAVQDERQHTMVNGICSCEEDENG